MPGVQAHPQPRVRNKRAHEQVTTGTPKQTAFPARRFTTYSALSPAIGLCVTVACENVRKLRASVEALRPHGFVVRVSAFVLAPARVRRIPHPTFRDDREAPL